MRLFLRTLWQTSGGEKHWTVNANILAPGLFEHLDVSCLSGVIVVQCIQEYNLSCNVCKKTVKLSHKS